VSDTTTPDPVESTPVEPASSETSATATSSRSAKPDAVATAPRDPAAQQRRKARRGAIISGAISLPLVTLGAVLLAVPLAVWYLSTVIRTLVVVVANIVSGGDAAGDANSTLGRIDPAALGGVTLGFAIVGAVFVLAGCLISFFVLRAHGVGRPGHVTGFGIAVGLVISAVLSATVGALTGLIFGTARTVGQVLGNAALGIALTTIGSVAVTVATGVLVWLWMERLFRAPEAGSAAASATSAD
jgi:hypothetical protein